MNGWAAEMISAVSEQRSDCADRHSCCDAPSEGNTHVELRRVMADAVETVTAARHTGAQFRATRLETTTTLS